MKENEAGVINRFCGSACVSWRLKQMDRVVEEDC